MSRTQKRNIKFVLPTNDCEGMGIDFGLKRFEPVRSTVRENVLWSLVIFCTHGESALSEDLDTCIKALKKIIKKDPNVISVGFTIDALSRLGHLDVC
jgi:hypothetical protein